jgi:carboxyl-terminal processing protease
MLVNQRARRAASSMLVLVLVGAVGLAHHPGAGSAAPAAITTASLAEPFVGTGVWLRHDQIGHVVVGSVVPGSSATNADVRAGDRVLAVDGVEVDGRLTDAADQLRGQADTEVRLLVQSGTDRREVTLRRTVLPALVASTELIPGVAMLRIPQFSRGISAALDDALLRNREARALVLDLRGNPGGLLDEAVAVADRFLADGPIVQLVLNNGEEQAFSALAGGDLDRPLVVLVDRGTASSAEVVTAALQDRGRAVVVGSATYGKGTVQDSVLQPDGTRKSNTIGHYVTPKGSHIDGSGLVPDVAVGDGAAALTAEQRALDVVVSLTAALSAPGAS